MLANARELVWALAAMALAFVLAYVLIIITTEAQTQTQTRVPVTSPIYDARIVELEREAVEEGYRRHVILLFDNWVKDPKNQPARALTGIDNGRRAFIDSMTGIDARSALPPPPTPRPRSIEKNLGK